MDQQIEAMHRLEAAIEALLEAHGERWTERSRVTIDRRPGVFALLEADGDQGYRPRLMIGCDRREPAAFGQALQLSA